tara:strand:+ start:16 stop:1023 length:1008 start_codon:yes stop_codon:yes gene_type:complete
MAFLDNSGDIILDAVLTDLGRRRMAQGNFKITKFALGDDEVDYGLYNKEHPSGSAYYDIEVLQTPVFEAFTATNANINYGLLSFTRTDLLYLPSLVTNEKISDSPWFKYGSLYYLSVNQETSEAIGGADALNDTKYYAKQGAALSRKIVIESGLDTDTLSPTSANRTSYIVSPSLLDTRFTVYFDSRFVTSIYAPTAASVFKNNSSDGDDEVKIIMDSVAASSAASAMDNYSVAVARGIPNAVLYNTETSDTLVSNCKGPRGTATALNFTVDTGLTSKSGGSRDSKYELYGKINQTGLFPDSKTYDYIDTTVYIQGTTTSAELQLPIRIIRYVSG